MLSAICPGCGGVLATNVAGLVWLGCQTCHYYGQLIATSQSAAYGAPSGATQPATTSSPTTPGATGSGDVSDASTPRDNELVSALELLSALRDDAQLFGDEIASAFTSLSPATLNALGSSRLPLVWDRLQSALDDLHRALGARHLGDYPPDISQVTKALVALGTWQILALQVVGRMNDMNEQHSRS